MNRTLCSFVNTGNVCGVSSINDSFEKRILKALREETYLETNGRTLKSIAQILTTTFEYHDKRTIGRKNEKERSSFKIAMLKQRKSNNLFQNRMELTL
jgi:hypothetical protein